MIPKIIHLIWSGREIAPWARKNIALFRDMNPDFTIKMHSFTAMDNQYSSLATQNNMQKAILTAYSVLEKEGGWYFDVDFVPQKSLSQFIAKYNPDESKMLVANMKGQRTCRFMACGKEWEGWSSIKRIIGNESYKYDERKRYDYAVLDSISQDLIQDTTDEDCFQIFFKNIHARRNKFSIQGIQTKTIYLAMRGMLRSNIFGAFQELGYEEAENLDNDIPEVSIIWNNLKATHKRRIKDFEGSKIFILEHGFFDRHNYSQVDTQGFLHRASWVNLLGNPAPKRGFKQLKKLFPSGYSRMHSRANGIVMVAGQVNGDTQLQDSEIKTDSVFRDLVASSLPNGTKASFRQHPKSNQVYTSNSRLPVQISSEADKLHYKKSKEAQGMSTILRGVKYLITINSNMIVDALLMGIPTLAFGPHAGIQADVVNQATVATLQDKIREMEQGWCPEQSKVDNFLAWLASVQWSRDELGDVNNWEKWLKQQELYPC